VCLSEDLRKKDLVALIAFSSHMYRCLCGALIG
jgi:hypothetical protein